MRRLVLLSLPLAVSLGGCTGFGTFLDHTFTLPGSNPDLPQADAENVRRSLGQAAPVAPLVPEQGNVWPDQAVLANTPTLSDLERNPAAAPGFAPTAVPGERPGLPAGRQPVPTGPEAPAPEIVQPNAPSRTPPPRRRAARPRQALSSLGWRLPLQDRCPRPHRP